MTTLETDTGQLQDIEDNAVFVVGKKQIGRHECMIIEFTRWNKLNRGKQSPFLNPGHLYTIFNRSKFIHPYFRKNDIKIKNCFRSRHLVMASKTIWLTTDDKIYSTATSGGSNTSDLQLIRDSPPFITKAAIRSFDTLLLIRGVTGTEITDILSFWMRSQSILSYDKSNIIPSVIVDIINEYTIFECNVYSDKGHSMFKPVSFFEKLTIIQISGGIDHWLFLAINGVLYSSGNNKSGKLGLGHTQRVEGKDPVQNPYFIKNKIKITDIECGAYHSLAVDDKGVCYSFGANFWGQCGVGGGFKIRTVSTPRAIDLSQEERIVRIKCGSNHSYVYSDSGRHFMFGNNGGHQCTLKKVFNEEERGTNIPSPFCINDVFNELTKNEMQIKDIYLGQDITWIIAENNTL